MFICVMSAWESVRLSNHRYSRHFPYFCDLWTLAAASLWPVGGLPVGVLQDSGRPGRGERDQGPAESRQTSPTPALRILHERVSWIWIKTQFHENVLAMTVLNGGKFLWMTKMVIYLTSVSSKLWTRPFCKRSSSLSEFKSVQQC